MQHFAFKKLNLELNIKIIYGVEKYVKILFDIKKQQFIGNQMYLIVHL